MRAIRRASAYPSPQAFAGFLEVTVNTLSNIENGYPISTRVQNLLVKKLPWISRSYIMDGDESAITSFTAQKLAPLLAEESDTTAPRRRSVSRSSGR